MARSLARKGPVAREVASTEPSLLEAAASLTSAVRSAAPNEAVRQNAWNMFLSRARAMRADGESPDLSDLGVGLGTVPLIGLQPPEVQPLWALTCGVGEALEQTGLVQAETEGENLLLITGQAAHVGSRSRAGEHEILLGELSSLRQQIPAGLAVALAGMAGVEGDPALALQRAMCTAGSLMGVPDRMSVAKPLVVVHWVGDRYARSGFAAFWRSVVVLGRHAQATVIHLEGSRRGQAVPSIASCCSEIHLGEGARLTYVQIKRWDRGVRDLGTEYLRLGAGSQLEWIKVVLAENQGWTRSHLRLEGENAEANGHILVAARNQGRWQHRAMQEHLARETRSDVRMHAAVAGASDCRLGGLVRISAAAQGSDGYHRSEHLLLGRDAKGQSAPQLEIEADQIRCSHAATVTRLNDEQLFYLMSRGLPPKEAERLLVEGFAEKVIGRVPVRSVAAALRQQVRGLLVA